MGKLYGWGCAGVVFCLFFSLFSLPCFAKSGVNELLEIFQEEQTVTTAAKYRQKTAQAPASVTVITAAEIKRHGYRKLSEALRDVTGMNVIYDRNYEYLGVRGIYVPGDFSSRVLVLINGLPTNDSVFGEGFIGYDLGIDMDQVKRIEIVKGPGSALYGTNALLAVINVITKNGEDENGLKVSGEVGTDQLEEGLISYGAKSPSGLDAYVSGFRLGSKGENLFFPEFDSPATNNGVFENADWEKATGYLGNFSYGDWSFFGKWSTRQKGIPTGSYGTLFNFDGSRTNDSSNFYQLQYAPKIDAGKDLTVKLFHGEYNFFGDYIYPDTPTQNEDDVETASDDWIGLEAQFNWRTSPHNLFTVGSDYLDHYKINQQAYNYAISGPFFLQPILNDNRTLQVSSLYIQDVFDIENDLSLILGGRYDDYSTFGQTINPRVGLIYSPVDAGTFKLLYGSAFRAPLFFELYYNDGGISSLANPDLMPEMLKTYEFVYEKQIDRNLFGSVSVFHTHLSNIISQVETSMLSSVTGLPLLQYQNVGSAADNGAEFTLKGKWKEMEAHLGYSYQVVRDDATGVDLPNAPTNLAYFGLSVPVFDGGLFCTVDVEHVGRRLDARLDESIDPYTVTNLVLFSDRLPADMSATFKIQNLFNVTYYDPVSTEFIQNQIRQNGRTYLLKLDRKF